MKNRLKYYVLALTVFLHLPSRCCAQTPVRNKSESRVAEKNLIVYLYRTKNTKAVAEIIQKQVGGVLVALELQTPYPENYKQIVAQVEKENQTGFLPPLKTKIDNIDTYDIVFIGFPTWGMKLPPPIKSFLKQYDLKGKTVIPFNTNAGYGVGSSFDTVKELNRGSTIPDGFSIKVVLKGMGSYL